MSRHRTTAALVDGAVELTIFAAAIAGLSSCGAASAVTSQPTVTQQSRSHTRRATSPCPCLYIANDEGNSVTAYPSGATGNSAPVLDLSGGMTNLSEPRGIAVDGSGNIYATNPGTPSVTVYAAGATGNVAPTAQIRGGNTGLSSPIGIAVNPANGDIYVANLGSNSITVYAAGSNGNVSPSATISGPDTRIAFWGGEAQNLASDAGGNIYVTSYYDDASIVNVFAAGSNGDAAPIQTIDGSKTKLYLPRSLAVDSIGNIYVGNGDKIVTVYPATANGNVRPTREIKGGATMELPLGIAVDPNDDIFVSNVDKKEIASYSGGATGKASPAYVIKGAKTKLDYPEGVTIH